MNTGYSSTGMSIELSGGDSEPMQLRNRANSQERRNSVSEVTDFFQSKITSTPKQTMPGRKASGKAQEKQREKEREKERKQELKEARESIKRYIKGTKDEQDKSENANGENQSTETVVKHVETSEVNSTNDGNHVDCNRNTTSTATQTTEDEMLKAIKELATKYQSLDDTLNKPKSGVVDQLAKTEATVTQLYSDINGAVSGIKVQLTQVLDTAKQNSNKIEQMETFHQKIASLFDENKRLVNELKTMQGLIQKLSQQTSNTAHQVLDLTKRGMEQNLVIHGADDSIEVEDPKQEHPNFTYNERFKYSAIKFFKDELNLDLSVEDIWKAHRMGPYKPDKVRPLIVKVAYNAKELIMEHITQLKGRSNAKTGQPFFVSEQVPEGVAELKKQTTARVKTLKEANDKKPKEERSKIQVINDKILVDGELNVAEVVTPQPSQLLFLSVESQRKVDSIQQKMVETDPMRVKNSDFIALAVKVHSIEEVNQAYIAVSQRHPSADHIVLGYALKENSVLKSGFCDDREYGAGLRVRKKLFELKARNTAIFVVRNFGGVHLGYNRFSVMEEVSKQALELLNDSV